MHGNVYEWVEDSYAEYPKEAGGQEAVEGGVSSDRVLRGGSWSNYSFNVRSSTRVISPPVTPGNNFGFRVARAPF
jgi:formylglycine-generating enzyme required for sulfatase activity